MNLKRHVLAREILQCGLNYTAVGKAVGVSRQMISHIVNCRNNPSWELQQRLVKFFGVPSEQLFIKEYQVSVNGKQK